MAGMQPTQADLSETPRQTVGQPDFDPWPVMLERPPDSRSSERPKASRGSAGRRPMRDAEFMAFDNFRDSTAFDDSRGTERPKASRGEERRHVEDTDRHTLDDRPLDSRSSARPKASRGGERRTVSEAERIAFEEEHQRLDEQRPIDSRGSERSSARPKASRGGERRTVSEVERIAFDEERQRLDEQRPIDSRGSERPKASRGSDRLKSRGGDRSRRMTLEGSDRVDVKKCEMDNQEVPPTLADWFSNNANVPLDVLPPQSESPRQDAESPDNPVQYVEEVGMGMRISSAFGSSRKRNKEGEEREEFSKGGTQSDRNVADSSTQAQGDVLSSRQESNDAPGMQAKAVDFVDSLLITMEEARPQSRKTEEKASRVEAASAQEKNQEAEGKPANSKIDRRSLTKEGRPESKGPAFSGQIQSTKKSSSPSTRPGGVAPSSTAPGKQQTVRSSGVIGSCAPLSPSKSGSRSAASASTGGDRAFSVARDVRPAPSRHVAKESSQDRLKNESSRLLTSRSNASTASSTSARARAPTSARALAPSANATAQSRRGFSTLQSENNLQGNHATCNKKGDIITERSKHDVGDKTARPGTSVVEQMNMKILEHALGVNPKLKNSPFARKARFGTAQKSKGRPTSPRPQDRVATVHSTISSSVPVPDTQEPANVSKKRPPWNPSTLDTLYSPRKPETSPAKNREPSPPATVVSTISSSVVMPNTQEPANVSKRRPPWNPSTLDTLYSPRRPETSPAKNREPSPTKARLSTRDAGSVDASARFTRAEQRLKTMSSGATAPTQTPSRGVTVDSGSQNKRSSCANDKTNPAHLSGATPASASPQEAPSSLPNAPPFMEVHLGSENSEVKAGVNEESISLQVDPFAIGTQVHGRQDDVHAESKQERDDGIGQDCQSPENEIYIPPEFQNLDRPVTRRDERPNTRRDDRPSSRGGFEDRTGTRSGLDDRPTTRGHDMRQRVRSNQIDKGEFEIPPAQQTSDNEYEDYYARIRAEMGYDDEAFESDAESDIDVRYQKMTISTPDGHARAEIMLFDEDSDFNSDYAQDILLQAESDDRDSQGSAD